MDSYPAFRNLLRRRDREIHDLRAVRNYVSDEIFLYEKGIYTVETMLDHIKKYIEHQGQKDYR